MDNEQPPEWFVQSQERNLVVGMRVRVDVGAAASRVLNEVAVHDGEPGDSDSLLSFEHDITTLARFALDTLAGRPTVPDSVTCDACGQRIAEGRIEVLVDGTAVHVRHSAR